MADLINKQELDELIIKGKQDDQEAISMILKQYSKCIWKIVHVNATKLYNKMIDYEDLYQEGIIGALAAIKSYIPNDTTSFTTYLYIVCQRRIVRYILKINNVYANERNMSSFNVEEESAIYNIQIDVKASNTSNSLARKDIIIQAIKSLGVIEQKVMHLYLKEMSYQEMSKALNMNKKQIDYRIQKSKKLLLAYINKLEETNKIKINYEQDDALFIN